MRKFALVIVALVTAFALCTLIAGCSGGGGNEQTALKDMREVTYEDNVLTVNLGANKSTGCEWTAEIGDDSIIGYGTKRVFHLSDEVAKEGETVGYSEITFEGKGAGQTTLEFSTPVDWEGNEPGYTYNVTVLVNDDGTFALAEPVEQ